MTIALRGRRGLGIVFSLAKDGERNSHMRRVIDATDS